jgi:hypothetical protein
MAGCTANVCIITKTEMIIANAGDSRSVLRQNNVFDFIYRLLFNCLKITNLNFSKKIKELLQQEDMVYFIKLI